MSIHKSRQKKAVENIKKIENKKDIKIYVTKQPLNRIIKCGVLLIQNKLTYKNIFLSNGKEKQLKSLL